MLGGFGSRWEILPAGRRHQSPLPTLICPLLARSQEILPIPSLLRVCRDPVSPSCTSLLCPTAGVGILLRPSDTRPWMPNRFLVKCSNFVNKVKDHVKNFLLLKSSNETSLAGGGGQCPAPPYPHPEIFQLSLLPAPALFPLLPHLPSPSVL